MRSIIAITLVCAVFCTAISSFEESGVAAAIRAETEARLFLHAHILADNTTAECTEAAQKANAIASGSCGASWTEMGSMVTGKAANATVDSMCAGGCLRTIMKTLNNFANACGLDSQYQSSLGQYNEMSKFMCVKNEHKKYCVTVASAADLPSDSCEDLKKFVADTGCCTFEMIQEAKAALSTSGAEGFMGTTRKFFKDCEVQMPKSCRVPADKAAKMKTKLQFTVQNTVANFTEAICEDFGMKTKLRGKGQVACKLESSTPASDGISGDADTPQTVVITTTSYADASGVDGLTDVKTALDDTNWTTDEWTTASEAAGTTIVADEVSTESPLPPASSARGVMVGVLAVLAIVAMLM